MNKIFFESVFQDTPVGRIPLHWNCVPLENIVEINPKPIRFSDDMTIVSFIGMADVTVSSRLSHKTDKFYGEVKKGFTSFYNNDVLVAKITPCFENGKGALVEGLSNGVGFGSTEFHVLRANPLKSCSSFIHYITTTEDFRKKGEMNMTGSAGQKRVGKDFIASYLVACPPLNEQKEIAKILSIMDKKIELIEEKISITRDLQTGLMQRLFSKGIGTKDINGNWKPHTKFQDSLLGRIPQSWGQKKLNDICTVKGGKRLPKGEALVEEDTGAPYIRVTDMYMGGVALKNIKYVPNHVIERIKNYTISSKDLFISVAGTVGLIGMISAKLDGANLTENADKLTNIKCDKHFLYYFLTSEFIQSTIRKICTVGAQPKLALTRIQSFDFFEPSLEEQREIASILSIVDKKINLLEQQKSEVQLLKKGMMQKLLTGEWRVTLDCDNAEAA
ncbi:restriction endonuclease subunit S [Pantoea ananatis]|uniref:restriction endonuclease subunit S n=1 Tax=Pantoea ananas TaxID=553 RepID=UPI0032EC484A